MTELPIETQPLELLLNIDDVARILSVSLRTLHRLRASGELPLPVRVDSRPRWRRADIEQFVERLSPAE